MAKCNLRNDRYCYYEKNGRKCWGCIHNEQSDPKDKKDNYISVLDKVDELFKYLTDEKVPDEIHVKSRPKLSPNKAWSLIWFLQEITHCLPDFIERCDRCGRLYDSDREGFSLDDQYTLNGKTLPKKYWGLYCDAGCVPRVDFQVG